MTEEEPFIALELIPASITPQKCKNNEHLPANKTKVTKNFFRKKDNPINDAKTCCNSATFL